MVIVGCMVSFLGSLAMALGIVSVWFIFLCHSFVCTYNCFFSVCNFILLVDNRYYFVSPLLVYGQSIPHVS